MSIVRLTFKQQQQQQKQQQHIKKKKKKKTHNLPPECKEKCKLSNNSRCINILYYGTLHRVNFRPIWT